jgi:release factor glutamine methyltransferase
VTAVPPREAQLLLAHVLGKTREWVMAHADAPLTPEQTEQYKALIAQAEQGVPLPYLLGHWEFFGIDFKVSPAVLIPRPETELLVERALLYEPQRIADVGTGSGIIAVTLAVKIPQAQIVASDRSAEALAVAKANADQQGVAERINFIKSDLLESYPAQQFDLICANLPYIPSADLNGLPVAEHEPRLAFDGGADGLDLIRRLLSQAKDFLTPSGRLLLEIEYRQGETGAALAQAAFPKAQVKVHQDLSGLDRLIEVSLTVSD